MEYINSKDVYILRIDKGEEIIEELTTFVTNENIKAGIITGIGATDHVEIGLFNIYTKEYHGKTLKGLHEITSLSGNITTKNKEPYLHLHINVSDESNNTYGGHLNKCYVSATAEIIIRKIDLCIERKFNDEIGLNLLDFNHENK